MDRRDVHREAQRPAVARVDHPLVRRDVPGALDAPSHHLLRHVAHLGQRATGEGGGRGAHHVREEPVHGDDVRSPVHEEARLVPSFEQRHRDSQPLRGEQAIVREFNPARSA